MSAQPSEEPGGNIEDVLIEVRVTAHTIARGSDSRLQYGGAELKRRLGSGEVFDAVASELLAECAALLHIPLPSAAPTPQPAPAHAPAAPVQREPLPEAVTPEVNMTTLIRDVANELKRLFPSDTDKQIELAGILTKGRKIKELQPGELVELHQTLQRFTRASVVEFLAEVEKERARKKAPAKKQGPQTALPLD